MQPSSKLAHMLHSTRQYLALTLPRFLSVLADLDLRPGLEGSLAIVPDYAVSLNTFGIRHLILQIDVLQLLPARQLEIVHLRDARNPDMTRLCGSPRILTELHKYSRQERKM